jgi:hypothetical protein
VVIALRRIGSQHDSPSWAGIALASSIAGPSSPLLLLPLGGAMADCTTKCASAESAPSSSSSLHFG